MFRIPDLLLCLSFCLTACGPSLEVKEETDELGLRKEYEVDEAGVKQGYLREYDSAGNLLLEERYTNDTLNGPRTVYDGAGTILAEENIVMGAYTGEHKSYDQAGNLEMTGVYSDGKMNGVWYIFYPDGGVKSELTFSANDQDGPVRQWRPDGKPEFSGTFSADGEDYTGDFFRYDEAGNLARILDCDPARGCMTYWTRDSTGGIPVQPVDMSRPTL